MEKSISNKIFLIVLLGSFVGSIFVGIGVFLLLISLDIDYSTSVKSSIIFMFTMQLVFLIPVYMIKVLIDRLVVFRIKNLITAMNQVSFGNLDVEVSVKGNDEISDLAEAFDRMRFKIKNYLEKGS